MTRFRKKPVLKSAHPFQPDEGRIPPGVFLADEAAPEGTRRQWRIRTSHGELTARAGDYIVTLEDGSQYPCRPDIWLQTHEPVGPGRWQARPVEVEAHHYQAADSQGLFNAIRFLRGAFMGHDRRGRLQIMSREGPEWVEVGDYIVRGVRGEYYANRKEYFEQAYEPVGE